MATDKAATDPECARKLGRGSMGVSIAGIVVTVVFIIILIIINNV